MTSHTAVPALSVYTLYSGSQGNSVCIRSEDTEILIDAGMSARTTQRSLLSIGSSLSNISAVFVTHEHSDHIGGLEVITKERRIPVHITEQSASKLSRDSNLYRNSVLHPPIYTFKTGNMELSSFVTPHDSEMCVGYVVKTYCGTIGVATDIGHMPEDVMRSLSECDHVILESNHDEKMLMCGPYPRYLKERILSDRGHLSNAACAECVGELSRCRLKGVLLAHLSLQNNRPDIAYTAAETAIGSRLGAGVSLGVACRCEPTRLV